MLKAGRCPLWVKGGHQRMFGRGPLCPESGHWLSRFGCPLYAKSRPLRLTGEAEFGLHVHWWGQCRTWPCYPVLFDLLEKPSMKTACQHPFDPITAPENPLLLCVSVFHGDHIISSTLQVSRANRQAPHVLEPAANIGVILRREFNLHCSNTRYMRKQGDVSD